MSDAWRPVLSGHDAERALEVAREVGMRLADPARLARAIETAPHQSTSPELAEWNSIGLAQGHPGLALAFAQLDACFPGEGWGDAAHRRLEVTVEALRADRRGASGLFSGLAGIAFAARSIDAVRYRRLLATLDRVLSRRTEQLIARLDPRQTGCAPHDTDVVSGLSGIGAYVLTRGDEASLRPVLARLVDLLRAGEPLSAWHTPVELLDDDARRRYPASYVDCGLAHGVPGPLALLSLADAEGVDMVGLPQAIEQAAAWLVEHIVEDEWGVNWPAVVPRAGGSSRDGPTRAAWCYGAPGIARALWLAGTARTDTQLQDLAVAALETVFRRPAAARRVDAPTFCHGVAGLLQITLRIANDAGSTPLRVAGGKLAAELVDRFDPDSVLGYRDLDPGGGSVDNAGLLEGAAGIVLVLLAAAAPVPSRWDRMFLLS